MGARGPRGMTGAGRALVPIAWGSVGYDSDGEPIWLSAGGELGRVPPIAATNTLIALGLDHPHDMDRLHVTVTTNSASYRAAEMRVNRLAGGAGIVIAIEHEATPFSVLVFEEQ